MQRRAVEEKAMKDYANVFTSLRLPGWFRAQIDKPEKNRSPPQTTGRGAVPGYGKNERN